MDKIQHVYTLWLQEFELVYIKVNATFYPVLVGAPLHGCKNYRGKCAFDPPLFKVLGRQLSADI